jgi:tRNA-guanine family transglycosylase
MRDQVAWIRDFLPTDKPVHLLGVGHIDDIIDLVHHGIDTFDCVEPTRLARMGVLIDLDDLDKPVAEWKSHEIDITQNSYRTDTERVIVGLPNDQPVTFSYLHHLFKQKELLGYTYATIHNLVQMERLMSRIREEIEVDRI